MDEAEIHELFVSAASYIRGDVTDEAEDAFFEIDSVAARDPELGLRLIKEVAAQLVSAAERAALGAGLLESFIRLHGESRAELIADGLLGSRALLDALAAVNELAVPSRLRAQLPIGLF